MKDQAQRIQAVVERIKTASMQSEQAASKVTLVAVSKTKSIADILTAYDAGMRHFGENRAKELAEKAVALQHLKDIQWHFIGHLQSKQSKLVAQYAHYFHAVDRVKIAKRLSLQRQKDQRVLAIFVQVNVSGETSKGGFLCDQWQYDETQWQTLLEAVRVMANLPYIKVYGLMTMAPQGASKANISRIFTKLNQLLLQLNNTFTDLNAKELSMGMSNDFDIAVEQGATYIRVGSAIFGQRLAKHQP